MGNGGSFTTVRAFYRKQGRIKYISHLDMNRCVSRALKRSRLPVWHTLGFNPHIYVTFALPLALGYESLCESFDFRLVEEVALSEAAERLNDVLPEGLTVYELRPVEQSPEEICWANYEMTLEFDRHTPTEVREQLERWMARPEILLTKKTKKGAREINVKEDVSLCEAQADEQALRLRLRCAAGAQLNINPTLLLDTFAVQSGCQPCWTRVVRTAILDGKKENFR